MTIKIKFFAIARDHAGVAELSLSSPDGATVNQALDQLIEQFPRLERLAPRLATAVNQEYVSKDHVLHDGDELALIPPVSGG